MYISYDIIWNSSKIYTRDKEWTYLVKNSENSKYDSLTLTVKNNILPNLQREIDCKY